MNKRYLIIDRIIEYGVYAYIIMMFLTKGEGIRNILIFGIFFLWLLTVRQRNNLYLLKTGISKLCLLFFGAIFISVIFSIDPSYSLLEFKSEPRKFIMLFPVIATVMTDNKRLEKLAVAGFFGAFLIACIGLYSHFSHGMKDILKPETFLMHVWHNKFATYLNTLIPFSLILFFILKRPSLKILFLASLLITLFALTLSSSRGGYLSFFSIAIIWSLYIAGKRKYSIKKIFLLITLTTLVVGTASWFSFSSPVFRQRISSLKMDIHDMDGRTRVWRATIHGFRQKPLTGWGYGKEIFKKNKPFINTPFKKRPLYRDTNLPFDDPHNTFLKVLFHQGISGLVPYLVLIIFSIKIFWKEAVKTEGIKSYILLACVSVLVGNYIVHSMLTILRLQDLAVILGLGVAALGTDESSHN